MSDTEARWYKTKPLPEHVQAEQLWPDHPNAESYKDECAGCWRVGVRFSDGDFRIFQPGDFLLTGTKRVIPFNQFHSDYAALYPDDEPAPARPSDSDRSE